MTITHVPTWTLGDRLRRIRRDAGLDQSEFAARLKVGRGAYAQWETDAGRPRDLIGVAQRIEVEFAVPATWVLGLSTLPRLDSNQEPAGYLRGIMRRYRDDAPTMLKSLPFRPDTRTVKAA